MSDYLKEFKLSEDGYYMATVPQLPGCMSHGDTIAEAKENIEDALELYLSTGEKHGIERPEPWDMLKVFKYKLRYFNNA